MMQATLCIIPLFCVRHIIFFIAPAFVPRAEVVSAIEMFPLPMSTSNRVSDVVC